MSGRALRRLLGGYAVALVVLCLAVRSWFSLSPPREPLVVETWWKDGQRVNRRTFDPRDPPKGKVPWALAASEEVVTGEARLYAHPWLFAMGLVAGLDGVKAEIDGKVAYATVDDLLSAQAYDHAYQWAAASFGWGAHQPTVLSVLSDQLGLPPAEIAARARLTRVRFERRRSEPPGQAPVAPLAVPRPERITEASLSRELVRDAIREAATHLARAVDDQGRYRYLVNAPTNQTVPGYNWPRHSGATFFLAQAARLLDDSFVRFATLRAAARLRDEMMRGCGERRCISEDFDVAEIGSSALALIAFTEIVSSEADGAYRPVVAELARFLRSQQRADGEFMHQYDRVNRRPVDVQFLYYSGEATLALARAHRITHDPADLEAARRALAHLSGGGWSFFGSRYYFSEEHWTCQAVAELWDRVPDEAGLEFCARWHEYQRRLQQDADETPLDGDGSFNFGPFASPRVTPASSRGEAAGALLAVLRGGHGVPERRRAEIPQIDRELRRALAFVLRNQLMPGPTHLFADPTAVRGAILGSPVDWQLRIDYAQHAGSMMVRWLELEALAAAP